MNKKNIILRDKGYRFLRAEGQSTVYKILVVSKECHSVIQTFTEQTSLATEKHSTWCEVNIAWYIKNGPTTSLTNVLHITTKQSFTSHSANFSRLNICNGYKLNTLPVQCQILQPLY